MWKAWASHAAQRRVDDRDAHTHGHARAHIGEQSWRRTRVSDEWSEPAASDKDGRQAGPELNESPVPLHLPCCIVGTRPESTGAHAAAASSRLDAGVTHTDTAHKMFSSVLDKFRTRWRVLRLG